jgi:hypothetical protein
MMSKRIWRRLMQIAAGLLVGVSLSGVNGQEPTGEAISIAQDEISGMVTSTKGPEGGVWVIAERPRCPPNS